MTTLYQHVSRPEWGSAQLIEERGDKRTFLFWNGERRTFSETHWDAMKPTSLPPNDGPAKTTSVVIHASEATDYRALRLQTRILGDAVTKHLYEKAIHEEPRDGFYANTGHNLVRDVLEMWMVGEYDIAAPGLSKAISYIEHACAVDERWGSPAQFYRSLHLESLGLAYWLNGDAEKSLEAFQVSAKATTEYFESDAKSRRTILGTLLLRWIAARDAQYGLGLLMRLDVPKPRAHPNDFKIARQNRYYDAYGRTVKTLAEDIVQDKPRRAIYERATKYLKKEIHEDQAHADYRFVDAPRHALWMKVFAADVSGIHDPKVALAQLYLLMPTIIQPPSIAHVLTPQR